jgi:toxin FitB
MVLSALMRDVPDAAVTHWINIQPAPAIWTTSINTFEIRHGIQRLPDGLRRRSLAVNFERALSTIFLDRVLPFDALAADHAARLWAERERRGSNIAIADTMIAGIILAYGATVATRNVKDFRDLGARVINPWDTVST